MKFWVARWAGVLALGLVLPALSWGELSSWRVGRPSLNLLMPGQVGAGGVEWHATGVWAFGASSWRGEGGDLLVEVSLGGVGRGQGGILAELAGRLGGSVAGVRSGSVSGYPAEWGTVGERRVLAVLAGGREWVVVASPKTASGRGLAERVIRSVVVERTESPRWVRRDVGGVSLNAVLPYELASDASVDVEAGERAFEVYFDGFSVKASRREPGSGSRFDLDGTMRLNIDSRRQEAGVTNFRSRVDRSRVGDLDVRVARVEFEKNGRKAKTWSLGAVDGGRLLMVNMMADPVRPEHEQWAERILGSLKESRFSYAGFGSRRVDEDLVLDLPGEVKLARSGSGVREYEVFNGWLAGSVRAVDVDESVPPNMGQLLDFLEVKYRGQEGIRDYKAERGNLVVDGVEGRILRTTHRRGNVTNHQQAVALFIPGKTVVVELLTASDQVDALGRILESLRVEVAAPTDWRRQVVGKLGVGLTFVPMGAPQVEGMAAELSESRTWTAEVEGLLNFVVEVDYREAPPALSRLLAQTAESIGEGFGGRMTVLEQMPRSFAAGEGLHARVKLEADGVSLPGDVLIVRRGPTVWTLVAVSVPSVPGSGRARMALVGSAR